MCRSENKQWRKIVKSFLGLGKKNNSLHNLVTNSYMYEGKILLLADEINNAFIYIVSKDLVSFKELRLRKHHDPIPENFIITPNEVDKHLSSIKISKPMGLDAKPNWI